MWSTLREALRGTRHRFHDGAGRPRRHPAGRSDGRRDGDGVDLRRRRRLLGRAPRRGRGRHRRPDRVDAHDHLHGRDGAVDRRDRAGGAADRRAGPRRRGARRRAVDPARPRRRRRDRAGDGAQCRPAAPRSWARPRSSSRTGRGFTTHHARRQCDRPAAVPAERGIPRRRRRGDRHARAGARQPAQHRARPVLHLRARSVSGAGGRGRGRGHQHRPRHRRALSGRHARPRPRPREDRPAPPAFRFRHDAHRCSGSRGSARSRS